MKAMSPRMKSRSIISPVTRQNSKARNVPSPVRPGSHGLLEGDQMFIKPEGFDELHDRHGIQHRLKDEKKWQPLGIGDGLPK